MKIVTRIPVFYTVIGIISAIGLLYWLYLQFLPFQDTEVHYYFNLFTAIVYLEGGIFGYVYYLHTTQNDKLKKIFQFFSLSMVAWALGGFYWAYYNLIASTANPYPSYADVFFILHAIFVVIAFWFVLDFYDFRPSRTNMKLTLVIIMLIYFAVLLITFNGSIDTTDPIFETLLNFLYPLFDSLILAIAIIAFTAIAHIGYGMGTMTLAIFLQAVGDILFSYRQVNDVYWNGDISDLFFLLSALTMIIGMYRFYKKTIQPAQTYGK